MSKTKKGLKQTRLSSKLTDWLRLRVRLFSATTFEGKLKTGWKWKTTWCDHFVNTRTTEVFLTDFSCCWMEVTLTLVPQKSLVYGIMLKLKQHIIGTHNVKLAIRIPSSNIRGQRWNNYLSHAYIPLSPKREQLERTIPLFLLCKLISTSSLKRLFTSCFTKVHIVQHVYLAYFLISKYLEDWHGQHQRSSGGTTALTFHLLPRTLWWLTCEGWGARWWLHKNEPHEYQCRPLCLSSAEQRDLWQDHSKKQECMQFHNAAARLGTSEHTI